MIADSFGQLQSFRDARNNRELQSYFRALEESRALAGLDEAAYRSDTDRAAALSRENYLNAIHDRDYRTGRADVAASLAENAANRKLRERGLDIEEARYKALADQRDELTGAKNYANIYKDVMTGVVGDESTLGNVAEPLTSDQYVNLLNIMEKQKSRDAAQLGATAEQLKGEFQATPGSKPALANTEAFQQYYKNAFDIAPATDPDFTAETAKRAVELGTQPGIVAQVAGATAAPLPYALSRYLASRREDSANRANAAIDAAVLGRDLATKQAFQKFGAEAVQKRRLALAPDVKTLSFRPTDPEMAKYLDALTTTTTNVPAADAASGAPTGTTSGVVVVRTKAERDLLPAGTVYIGPDGRRYTKQ